jgi:hypothetical protein
MRFKNALLSNILILLLAGTTEFIFNSNALAVPGDLYASDPATNSIAVYAHDGTRNTFATGLNNPQGVAFDHSANLYVADAGSGNIYKFTKAGVRTTFASGLLNPIGLVVDGTDLLVAENNGNAVWSYPLTGGPRTLSIDVTGPLGLGFDGINRYVANGASVFKVAPDGTMTDIYLHHPAELGNSRNVTVGTDSDVFVSTDTGDIAQIRSGPQGRIIIFATGLVSPWGLALRPRRFNRDMDGVGDLLVADTGAGQIYEFTRDGSRTPFGPALGSPNFLAFETIFPPKADFNGDGKSDILWQNNSTGDRLIWLMNGTSFIRAVGLATVGTSWNIVGSEDFNADLNSDILWQNSVTGERLIWLMNGTGFSSAVSLGTVGTSWNMVGSGDFNGDGMPDILWQNSVTGERLIWLMNGTTFSSFVSLGIVATSWNIAGAADFSGDSQTDILWQNSLTGERLIWLMNGTSFSSFVSLGIVGTVWDIRNF